MGIKLRLSKVILNEWVETTKLMVMLNLLIEI